MGYNIFGKSNSHQTTDTILYTHIEELLLKYLALTELTKHTTKEKYMHFLVSIIENNILFWEDVDYCSYFKMAEDDMYNLLTKYIVKIINKSGLMIYIDCYYK